MGMASLDDKPKKSKKPIFILSGIIGFIVLLVVANVDTANKEKKALEAQQSQNNANQAVVTNVQTAMVQQNLSDAELEQQALIQTFGEPPVGFRWDNTGELIALSDESLTSEEVAWRYLQALSNKDFATAQKYAQTGYCVNTYNSFYDSDSYSTSELMRTIYSEAIGSLELLECKQNGIFANGTCIYTFKANILDLSNKTFWEDDSEEVFETIRGYTAYENDTLKAEQYVNNLIMDYYRSGEAKMQEVMFDIVVDKVRLGGYLISDDSNLDVICRYMDGTTVYQYIMDKFSVWSAEQAKSKPLGEEVVN